MWTATASPVGETIILGPSNARRDIISGAPSPASRVPTTRRSSKLHRQRNPSVSSQKHSKHRRHSRAVEHADRTVRGPETRRRDALEPPVHGSRRHGDDAARAYEVAAAVAASPLVPDAYRQFLDPSGPQTLVSSYPELTPTPALPPTLAGNGLGGSQAPRDGPLADFAYEAYDRSGDDDPGGGPTQDCDEAGPVAAQAEEATNVATFGWGLLGEPQQLPSRMVTPSAFPPGVVEEDVGIGGSHLPPGLDRSISPLPSPARGALQYVLSYR